MVLLHESSLRKYFRMNYENELIENEDNHGKISVVEPPHTTTRSSEKPPDRDDSSVYSICGLTVFGMKRQESTNKAKIIDTRPRDWDICIVTPGPSHFKNENHNGEPFPNNHMTPDQIISRLEHAGLLVKSISDTSERKRRYIFVGATLKRLKKHAQAIRLPMLMNEEFVEAKIDKSWTKIKKNLEMTNYRPYQYFYHEYHDINVPDAPPMFENAYDVYFKKGVNQFDPFSPIVRIRLILSIIENPHPHKHEQEGTYKKTDDNVDLEKLTKNAHIDAKVDAMSNSVVAYFPMHNDEQRNALSDKWLKKHFLDPWNNMDSDVKEYVGEKAALYFVFTVHYTKWLVYLCIASVIVVAEVCSRWVLSGSYNEALLDSYSIPCYCVFVAFWAQLLIETWKRQESSRALEWGMSNFEDLMESIRHDFTGTSDQSYIDGSDILYNSPSKKFWAMCYSNVFVFIMILGAIGFVSLIFYLQYLVSDVYGSILVSILSAIQVIVLNYLYQNKATKLTESENHRTDTEFEDSLIGKIFAFTFVNSYASLFYLAFIKHNTGQECDNGPCVVDVSYQLAVVFSTKLTVDKIWNYVGPKVFRQLTGWKAAVAEKLSALIHGTHHDVEASFDNKNPNKNDDEILCEAATHAIDELDAYDSLGVMQDYAQIFVQFGYVTLFVAAFPIAPLLAYISNCIEIKADGHKLLFSSRRVIPTGAQDIGTWLVILQMTAIASVITNAGILCFTMHVLEPASSLGLVWIFIGFQYFVFSSMGAFAYFVEDVPTKVQVQRERHAYLTKRTIKFLHAEKKKKKKVVSHDNTANV